MVSTPLYPMVLLIIIPMKNGYFIGNINPTFSDKPICLRGPPKMKNIHYRFPKWWISYWKIKNHLKQNPVYPASASTGSFWKDPCPDPLFALRPLRSLRGRALAPLSSGKKVGERLGFFRGSARFKHQKWRVNHPLPLKMRIEPTFTSQMWGYKLRFSLFMG